MLCGSGVATGLILKGDPGEAAVLLPAFVLLAGVNSPLIFPSSIGALEAERGSALDGRLVVFWRSGWSHSGPALSVRSFCPGPTCAVRDVVLTGGRTDGAGILRLSAGGVGAERCTAMRAPSRAG